MGIGLTKIKHVKIPVTDVQRSVTWYQSLLDLELYMEFVEQGVVRGASLLDRDGGYEIALRDREVCASRPSLAGFDVFALAASSRGRRTPVSGRRRASARGRRPRPGWHGGTCPVAGHWGA
jgi:catechol 2,3-dioxygenase-like lactoylglutathione lyase family enzyme